MATEEQRRVAGKWRACHAPINFHKGKVFIRPEGSELLIATVSAELRLTESIYASRLMAAAPDLLAALEAINRLASPNPERTFDVAIGNLIAITATARAAIAKAEGR